MRTDALVALAALLTVSCARPATPPRPTPTSATGPGGPPLNLVVQQGLRGISAIAVHPDGRFAVIATSSKVLKVWHLGAQRELLTMSGHTDRVSDVAVSPDGSMVASVAADATLRLWAWGDTRPSRIIDIVSPRHGTSSDATKVAFSADGTRVFAVVNDFDHPLLSWDVSTGVLASSLPGAGSSLAMVRGGVVAGHAGKLVFTSDDGRAVRATVDAHPAKVHAIVAMPDGATVISSGDDGLKVWDVAGARLVRTLAGPTRPVYALVALDDRRVLAVDWSGTLFTWDVTEGLALASFDPKFPLDLNGATTVALVPKTSTVLVGNGSGTLSSWDFDKAAAPPVTRSRTETYGLHAAYDAPRGMLAVSDGSTLQLYRMENASLAHWWHVPGGAGQLAFTPDGRRLLVQLAFGGILVVDPMSRTIATTIVTPPILYMATSADGRRVAGSTAGGGIYVWSIEDGAQVALIPEPGFPTCVALSADGTRLLAGGGLTTRITEWDVAAATSLVTFRAAFDEGLKIDDTLDGCAFLEGDRTVAITSGRKIHLFDRTGALGKTVETTALSVWTMAEPKPGQLLVAGDDNTIGLWDLKTGASIRTYAGHTSTVHAVMMASGRTRFLSLGDDRTVREWKLGGGSPVLTLIPLTITDGPGHPPRAVSVVVDGSGYFDFSSPEGLDFVHLVRGSDVIGLNQLVDVYYRPQLVAHLRAGKTSAKVLDLSSGLRLPPAVTVEARADKRRISVRASAVVHDGGLTEWMLFRNSRLVARTPVASSAVTGTTVEARWEVDGVPGKNTFVAVARSADGIKAYSTKVDVMIDGANTTPSRMFVVAVGIDRYGTGEPAKGRGGDDALVRRGGKTFVGDLAFAAGDARAVERRLKKLAPSDVAGVTTKLLLDGKATRAAILRALADVAAAADSNDTVVVFIAGHGLSTTARTGRIDRKLYLYVPADYKDVDQLATTGLSSDDLLAALGSIPAGNIVLLLDTCESGASNDAFANDVFGTLQVFGEASGVHVMASAAVNQAALELKSLGHGAFTFALLDQLACQGFGAMTFRTLAGATEKKLKAVLQSKGRQNVVISSSGADPAVAGCTP